MFPLTNSEDIYKSMPDIQKGSQHPENTLQNSSFGTFCRCAMDVLINWIVFGPFSEVCRHSKQIPNKKTWSETDQVYHVCSESLMTLNICPENTFRYFTFAGSSCLHKFHVVPMYKYDTYILDVG